MYSRAVSYTHLDVYKRQGSTTNCDAIEEEEDCVKEGTRGYRTLLVNCILFLCSTQTSAPFISGPCTQNIPRRCDAKYLLTSADEEHLIRR